MEKRLCFPKFRGLLKPSVICALLLTPGLGAQTFRVGNVSTLKATAFNSQNQTLYAIWTDSIRAHQGPDFRESRLIALKNVYPDWTLDYDPICADSSLYFIEKRGGKVFSLKGDSMLRLDRSYSHRMQNGAALFVRNDTIMRYGGYGFWSFRNFFTYFDNTSREWELVVPYGSNAFPEGTSNPLITQESSHIFVLWGRNQLPQKPYFDIYKKDAWVFNPNVGQWEYLGEIPFEEPKGLVHIDMGNRLLFFNNTSYATVLNPGKNLRITYEVPADPNRSLLFRGSPNPNVALRNYYHNGLFYLIQARPELSPDPNVPDLYYTIMPEGAFLKAPVSSEALYMAPSNGFITAGLFVLSLGVGGWFLVLVIKKKRIKKVLVFKTHLAFRGTQIDLSDSGMALLRLLIRNGGEATMPEVMRLIENPGFSEGHNARIKNQLVAELNLKLRTLLNTDDSLIKEVRSAADRRNKSYSIDVSLFKISR